MLDWLTRSSRPSDAYYAVEDDGASCLEEPPETPAHLFAVRAFQTAIFGTPHPSEHIVQPKPPPIRHTNNAVEEEPLSSPKPGPIDPALTPRITASSTSEKANLLASPAKGILLTPGTAATRRKTVSFSRHEAQSREKAQNSDLQNGLKEEANHMKPMRSDQQDRRPPTTLTKTLIELSKKRSSTQPGEEAVTPQKASIAAPSDGEPKEAVPEAPADYTIDLSQPRSRSGQHWKTEYEQYQKRSNREMKRILKHGQSVKSYAVKKDSEATTLDEKLKRALTKVEALEAKVSKLASRLSLAQDQGPNNESDQMRLVSELAQQTALAVRYKQKVDQHRKALQQQYSADALEDAANDSQMNSDADEAGENGADGPTALTTVDLQVSNLREASRKAEERCAKLETENHTLKRSLARVKEEMMSYESRRQAREERLKKREEKHKAAKEEAEARLAQLKIEHQKLLESRRTSPVEPIHPNTDPNTTPSANETETDKQPTQNPTSDPKLPIQSSTSLSPRKRRPPKPAIDIWTANSSPNDNAAAIAALKEGSSLLPSSVKHDIQRTLQEITHNLMPAQPPNPAPNIKPSLPLPSPTHQPPTPQPTPPHPHPPQHLPLPTQPHSSPQRLQQPPQPPSHSRSHHPPYRNRTTSLASTRTSSLSAERAAAAKARLAKRSAEKRGRGISR